MGGSGARQALEAHVVQDLARPLLHDPAVAVARVLAQADVCDHDQLRCRVFYGAGSELDYPLGVICSARRLVFLVRDAEEQDRGHPEAVRPLRLSDSVVYREPEDAWHGRYRVLHVLSDRHEDRVDEVARGEPRLAHPAAQGGRAARPPEPLDREWHRYSPLFAGSAASRSATASTNPGIVYSLASTSTRMPRLRAVSAVMGPMQATRVPRSSRRASSSPNAPTKFSAVELAVKVTQSTSPARLRLRRTGPTRMPAERRPRRRLRAASRAVSPAPPARAG